MREPLNTTRRWLADAKKIGCISLNPANEHVCRIQCDSTDSGRSSRPRISPATSGCGMCARCRRWSRARITRRSTRLRSRRRSPTASPARRRTGIRPAPSCSPRRTTRSAASSSSMLALSPSRRRIPSCRPRQFLTTTSARIECSSPADCAGPVASRPSSRPAGRPTRPRPLTSLSGAFAAHLQSLTRAAT